MRAGGHVGAQAACLRVIEQRVVHGERLFGGFEAEGAAHALAGDGQAAGEQRGGEAGEEQRSEQQQRAGKQLGEGLARGQAVEHERGQPQRAKGRQGRQQRFEQAQQEVCAVHFADEVQCADQIVLHSVSPPSL